MRGRRSFSSSAERSRIIAVTVLFKQRQITAHCYMIPSSAAPLSEISFILLVISEIQLASVPLLSTESTVYGWMLSETVW